MLLALLSSALVGSAVAAPHAVVVPPAANLSEYRAALLALVGGEHGAHAYAPAPRNVSQRAFPCQTLPASPAAPTSVHALRPGDIGVVGALGDSITAGFGAESASVIGLARRSPTAHPSSAQCHART